MPVGERAGVASTYEPELAEGELVTCDLILLLVVTTSALKQMADERKGKGEPYMRHNILYAIIGPYE
jgi:hypothetical protein